MQKLGRYSVYFVLFSFTVTMMFMGCAAKQVKPSGFLGDYSALRPDPEDPKVLYYEKPNVEWKNYTKLLFDPIMVYYLPEAKNRAIPPDELKKLTDYFRDAAIEAVKDAYPVVDEPGPGILRIRAAITDVIPASQFANIAMIAAVGIPVDMGGASMEVEFLDSVSNERLAAMVDRKKGSYLDIADVFGLKAFTKWGYAKAAFKEWAKELREALDEVHRK